MKNFFMKHKGVVIGVVGTLVAGVVGALVMQKVSGDKEEGEEQSYIEGTVNETESNEIV